MKVVEPARPPTEGRRYSHRLVLLEEPQVAARLAEMARQNGHSLASEVRGAVRAWLRDRNPEGGVS